MKRIVSIPAFLVLLTSVLGGQTVLNFGTGKILGSTAAVSDANAHVSGTPLGTGVSFDLTVTATSVATPTLALSLHADGIGVTGGSGQFELDNRNNLSATDDESLVFTLSNVTGLAAGQSLRISGIGTRSGGTTEKQFTLFDGATSTSGSFTPSIFTITVPELASVKLTAVGPTTGAALNSRFIINQLLLTVTGGSGTGDPGTGAGAGSNAAAKITASGVDADGHPFFTFNTIAGESYEIQSSTDLNQWTPLATLSGTGGSLAFTNEFIHVPSVAKIFHRAVTVLTPNGNLANTTLAINQTWAQETAGYARTALVQVPSGAGPHPVVILLHGNRGTGAQTIGALNPHLNNAIRVAPDGYLNSWNVDGEESRAPDVAFIRDLIALLKTYDNVDAGKISLFGISNGSGLTNRLLIELDGAAFQNAACQVSQMLVKMHHDDAFWFNATGTNDYDQTTVPAPRRRILAIGGTADPTIPYNGGTKPLGTFLPAQESIYRFAQAMGEGGPQLTDSGGIPGNGANGYSAPFVKYAYLDGQVVHYKLIGGDHGLRVGTDTTYATEARQIVATFLLQ